MLFNSIDFAIFLPIVFFGYWFVFNKNLRIQNLFILIASYFFYGWWDWRFLSLVIISSTVDYWIGLNLGRQTDNKRRRRLLYSSMLLNLGLLGFFKYFNFFIENFIAGFSLFGHSLEYQRLDIILPIGISFYTFQTMSYTIDIYKRKFEPTTDVISFFAYVSFFPQLVAGPIERAAHLIPQFLKKRQFEYEKATDGLRQILWGLFKKMVVADNCATQVNLIFDNYQEYSGPALILGSILFTIQIYGDFSGYSDIAIGTARLFGFNLRQNFAYPYFSRDIAEFWNRWHISLTSWFKDYIFFPLGGFRGDFWIKFRNVFALFFVSGIWHGANWTFVMCGILFSLSYVPLLLSTKNRPKTIVVAANAILPTLKELTQMLVTFATTSFIFIFFRSETLWDAVIYIKRILENPVTDVSQLRSFFELSTFIFIGLLFGIEWLQRSNKHGLEMKSKFFVSYRYVFYLGLALIILIFANQNQDYIYFQF